MICRHCQKENPESVKYCIHCGKPLDEPERQTPPVFDPHKEEGLNDDWSKPVEEEKTEVPKPSKKNSHVPVLIALGVLVGLLVIGGVVFVTYANHQQEIRYQQDVKHQQEITRLEQEKEQEKEARKKAEEEADDLQDENEYLEDRNDRLEDRQKDESESDDHYQYGFEIDIWYKANYNMALRNAGDYNATQTGHLRKDERIFIEEIISGSNGSYWGRSSSGDWVCMQDNDYDYLREE